MKDKWLGGKDSQKCSQLRRLIMDLFLGSNPFFFFFLLLSEQGRK